MDACVDKLSMALSAKTSIDGLWIGASGGDEKELLRKVREALQLIRQYDPLRYERIRKDVGRIFVAILPGAWGIYKAETESCQIDSRFVATAHPIFIASIIVHEATHARLRRFGYAEALRHRLEVACHKQQLVFARRHPGGDVVVEWLQGTSPCPADSTNEAWVERDLKGRMEAARHLGVPPWIVTTALRIRGLLERLAKLRRRMSRIRQPS